MHTPTKGGEKVSLFIQTAYRSFREGNLETVPDIVFDGGFAESVHDLGFLPRAFAAAAGDCISKLENILVSGNIHLWRKMSKYLKGEYAGYVLFGDRMDEPYEIDENVSALAYFFVFSTGVSRNGCFLADGEHAGVIVGEGGFQAKGYVQPRGPDPDQFALLTGRVNRLRISLEDVRREESLFERSSSAQKSCGTSFDPGRAIPHEDRHIDRMFACGVDENFIPLPGEVDPDFDPDFDSIRAERRA